MSSHGASLAWSRKARSEFSVGAARKHGDGETAWKPRALDLKALYQSSHLMT